MVSSIPKESFLSIEGTLTDTTVSGQSVAGSNGNEAVGTPHC